ncbi:MAG: hypothetical protein ACPGO4_00560 [Flavobacteriaceae bacterium]|jgi:hypothetical protein
MDQKAVGISFEILQQLNVAKLEYMKAAELQLDAQKKRYLNQQGMLRNRFFQEVMAYLRSHDISTETFVLRNINFNQRMITALNGRANDQTDKCIEADNMLLSNYEKLISTLPDAQLLLQQQLTIGSNLVEVQRMATATKAKNKITL